VLAFVGPTGVGKTTTIAKIGANLHLKEGRNVCFLTMDNYRIGGKEQLLQYAEIIDLPIRVVQQRDELITALENERTEYFLLDTAGRNQKKGLDLNEIRNNLRVIGLPLDIHLVVSATTKYTDLLEIMEKFEILGYERVILTKVDETNTFGSVISALSERKKQLAYVCMGQNVPDDIKIAEPQDLVARALMRLPLAGGEPSVVSV
jgi:flagellar biosynthesis protein FlhF